jgi:hypothetical protein
MKAVKTITVFLFLSCSVNLFATAQAPDVLVYKGDTVMLFANPLESNKLADTIRNTLKGCMTTGCWRMYQAFWEITGSQLYLTDIKSCCYSGDGRKIDMHAFFGKKYRNGKVKAGWVNGNITAVSGKCMYYIHSEYLSIYENEILFAVNKGKITKTEYFDNSRTRKSKYKEQILFDWVSKQINRDILPSRKTTVVLEFSGNENGIIDSVMIRRSTDSTENKIFEKEAVRVIKTIPEWDIVYRRGKFDRNYVRYTFPFRFNKKP